MKNLFVLGKLCCIVSLSCMSGNSYAQTNSIQSISSWLLTKYDVMADGNMAVYAPQYSNAIDHWDARKMPNPGENFGISRYGYTLAVEARQPVGADTLFFHTSNLKQAIYKLKFLHQNMANEPVTCSLFDAYSNKYTPISLTDTSNLEIIVDANPESKAADRFMLIYRPLIWAVLPVNILRFDARLSGQAANIVWAVHSEKEMQSYTLETSRDGRHFTPIAEIMAFNHLSGRAEYNYTHILNDNGKYFFRLSSLGLNGHTEQTKVIVLQNAEALTPIRVVPNPASGTGIGVELSSTATANTYTWQIHSPEGKLLQSGKLAVPAQTTRANIQLRERIASGTYFLSLWKGEHKKSVLLRIDN